MKKCYLLIIAVFCITFSACTSQSYDLERMGDAVKSHFRYRDQDNGTVTKIEYLKALSYEKIPEDKREKPDEEYLCKVYVKGTWAYDNSYRVFNMNDTLDCFFDKSKSLLRIGEIKEHF
ncbi:hypothetical protein M2451_002821 [Dysgonomonas sp. PFB1-18]|uniref:hypothetical protein n=1 Tax=unclassified Dysgonomonas TaxID=2630389 RepID=UPI002474863E|nr:MULTISPECIES: hypothetical protein [unclassified Dysgonomonas]MDH6309293.1 hypothetical protein [Dysgonomonas sp. PF1-14]MDH6339842.1 hypothetical protein [Dysgonomonas sp. PF1-16]MDH6381490.1 hypothetical protein [Dysgonomonas sp. PFB1-18]MDH6398705.1 hypothetical protein [Dysgonomonas sp. PF1-23]